MTDKPPTVLGWLESDFWGDLLETGFVKFHSPLGCGGLARWQDDRLEILAVHANQPGTGQLRAFLNQCKQDFPTICIWHIMNPEMDRILARYGFYPWSEMDHQTGEQMTGFRWDLPKKLDV